MGAVLYIRVSTDEQVRQGVSLGAQEERLRAYCTMRGLEVVDVIRDEGVSAFKHLHTRPGGAALLQAIAAGKAAHVVALKLDRLFRNAADALALTEKWNRAGVALHLVDMGGAAMDTASPTGRMMLTMLAGFAEFERALISERTAQALTYKRDQRQAYAPTPYGYRRKGARLEAHRRELATVERIRKWAGQGMSFAAIARRLNADAVPTKRGGQWYASTVRYLVRNELYELAAAGAAL
jgi:DNA invertase Pin-like site-specific DNA recombinase